VRRGIDQASEIGGSDATDVFTQVSRGIDKNLRFVEAHGQASR
jgi:starvation-inducible DNA-binding protein